MADRLRAGELARAAGLSVQQLRSYLETGVLPPAERSAGGHRRFTTVHAEALTTARALAAGHGWATTRTVMRAVHDGDEETALAALDASHARLDRERGELTAVHDALGTVLAAEPPASARRPLLIGDAARAVGVRPPVLRLWERHGLLHPEREPATGYRRYPAAEVHLAHVTALLRRGGHPLAAIAAVLRELRTTGSPDRLRAELARRRAALHRASRDRLAAAAALHTYLLRRAERDPDDGTEGSGGRMDDAGTEPRG
ncbi:MerR family transcriptional regulator [Streptomyces catenulae]|uniref:MerR family transcriptional regulator n=1 Tax=Streptomyces catenulae TaxID=66875 RepID=A0ABV2YUP7_9ACTN|nr:MerR family transcriptional regulator [Streptomyces catenulae]